MARNLEGPLAVVRDVILTDSTVIRLDDLPEKRLPACRTNHTKAALKVTAERDHDGPVFCVGPWVRDHLLMFDRGYFLTRLKGNADPMIVAVNRLHRGRAIPPTGEAGLRGHRRRLLP